MFNERLYDYKMDKIHEEVTMPLDSETKKAYELFTKFMGLYESERELKRLAFRECLGQSEEDIERTLDDLS